MAREHAYTRVKKREIPSTELKKVTIRVDSNLSKQFKSYCKKHKVSAQQLLEDFIKHLLDSDV